MCSAGACFGVCMCVCIHISIQESSVGRHAHSENPHTLNTVVHSQGVKALACLHSPFSNATTPSICVNLPGAPGPVCSRARILKNRLVFHSLHTHTHTYTLGHAHACPNLEVPAQEVTVCGHCPLSSPLDLPPTQSPGEHLDQGNGHS